MFKYLLFFFGYLCFGFLNAYDTNTTESRDKNSLDKCHIRVLKNESNPGNNETASISINKTKNDSLLNISIQTAGQFLKDDIPCEGNIFIADYPEYSSPYDSTLINFRWLNNNQLVIEYDRKLRIVKKESTIRNISINYAPLNRHE
jgi:hypothetical protein